MAFNFINWGDERRINFYSGRVTPLGVAAVAGRFKDAQAGGIEAVLMNTEPTPIQRKLLQPVRKDIQLLVADVVMTAKWKDGRDWRRDAVQDTSRFRKRIGRLNPENMAPLLVFVGGGGANSKWYQDAILSTHADFGHLNAGVPPYELSEVGTPSDVKMNGLTAAEFGRFAVAYGLSVPSGEGPDIGLPSEFSYTEPPRVRQHANVVDYLDSKDVYE